jgi:hypothetical protein
MKVSFPARAIYHHNGDNSASIVLQVNNQADDAVIHKLFETKASREKTKGSEYMLECELNLPYQKRTFHQMGAVWLLVKCLFESQEGRAPSKEESYDLYLECLESFADRKPNKLSGGSRPVHLSEANSLEASHFIDKLLGYLAEECDLSLDLQSTVQGVLKDWEAWKGGQKDDPNDYIDGRLMTEAEWRKYHVVSMASGRSGALHLHHIAHKKEYPQCANKAWCWCMLTDSEHIYLHNNGEDAFLRLYGHLRGRFERAHLLASRSVSSRNLVDDALNGEYV